MGQIFSLTGIWMQLTATGWLIYTLTDSALALGIFGFARFSPVLLFSLVGGVIADRYSKHGVLLFTQSVAMILAFSLAVLTLTGAVEVWHIYLISFANGLVLAFDAPTRQSFFSEMVEKDDLMNAISLNSMAFNMARVIGPGIAGILVVTIGEGGCFLINGFSFAGPLFALTLMRKDELLRNEPDSEKRSILDNLREGIAYVRSKRTILTILTLIAASSIFAISYVSLMPIFARDILKIGATGNGLLYSAAGAGALLGAIFMASIGNRIRKGLLFTFGNFALPMSLIAFSLSRSVALSLVLLCFAGFGAVMQNASANTLLQTISEERYRGRVMSLFTLVFIGMFPLGDMFEGTMAQLTSAPFAISLGASLCLIFALWAVSSRSEIRRHA